MFRRAGLDFETVKRQARSGSFRPIDLGAYANGIYFLRVKADGQTYVQKIVMEK